MFDRDFIVLELANILAGPITGQFFAELGARVIKVENPHTKGDATRGFKMPSESPDADVSAYFCCTNWGKESVAIDTATADGQALVHALARKADVVIASFKPGDDVKLGLDHATLRALNPRLIYGQISAYGADDPRPGFDAILQAEAGFTYLNGEPDGPATKMPVALIDLLAAHHLKEGLLLALIKRGSTGEGSLVSTSLLKAGVSSLANQATNYLIGNVVPKRLGSEHPNIVPYGTILKCSDGRELVIAAATEKQYRELMASIGLADVAQDPQYATGQLRVRHREALLARIRTTTEHMTGDELAAKLTAAKVPFGFVNDMAAVFAQTGARELLMHGRVHDGRDVRGVHSLIVEGDAVTLGVPSPPPGLNEHARPVLGDLLGHTRTEIAEMQARGAFGSLDSLTKF
jgi:crotonobetainyl-CoA:carnitine CoA-transferase CaiB-like acyl-CoA transferase